MTNFRKLPESVQRTILATFGGREPTPGELSQAIADYRTPVNCPKCRDAGYLRLYSATGRLGSPSDPYDEVMCGCQREKLEARRYKRLKAASNLTAEMDVMTFTAFRAAADPAALEAAKDFALDPEGWLIFVGPTGTGKTHLMAAIAHTLMNREGAKPLYVVAVDFLDFLRAGFKDDSAQRRYEDTRNAPILLVDDIGAEQETQWVQDRWYGLFNYRHARKMPTVIATNLDITPANFGDRLYSRFSDAGLCSQIRMKGIDYRQTSAQATKKKRTRKAKGENAA